MEAGEECEYGRHARLTDTFERRHAKGWIIDDVTANYIATVLAIEVQAKKHKVLLGSDAEIKRPPKYATPSCPRTPVGKRPACQQICCGHQEVVTARSTASLGFKKGRGAVRAAGAPQRHTRFFVHAPGGQVRRRCEFG